MHAAREHCGTAHCRAGMVFTPHCRAGYTVVFPANPARGAPLPGGMYASPTNTRYRVYNTGDGWRRKVYGPHACGPYKPTGKRMFAK